MKKLYLLLFVLLLGCGSKAPKCDTVEMVKKIMFELLQGDVHDKIMMQLYGFDYTGISDLSETEKKLLLNKIEENRRYVEMYINGNVGSIPKDVLDFMINYYNNLSITNIRTNSVDETSKSCNCSATFKIEREIELNYSTQRNSNGEIYVEVER